MKMFYIKHILLCIVSKQVLSLKRLTESINSDKNTNVFKGIDNLLTEINLKEYQVNDDSNKIHKYLTTVANENNVINQEIHSIIDDKITVNDTDLSTVLGEILNEDTVNNGSAKEIEINNLMPKFNDIKDFVPKLDNTVRPETVLVNENFRSKTVNESLENEESDGEFWQPSGRRIYKGKITKVKHFPFMASIEMFQKFQCAGSIIKSDLVITAASCLQLAWNNRFFRENPAFLTVRIGSTYYNGGGEVIAVLEVYFHPSYDPKNLRHNVCILRLVRRIKFKRRRERVKKIDIDREASPLPLNTDGIAVVGWGAKEASNILHGPWENRLAFAVLDIYPIWECKEVYSSEYVTHKNFCAGFFTKGGGACNHDVGGPGIVDGILAGIISFGAPVCGASDSPTVFVKVGYYADWIDEIMTQDVPHGNKRTTLKPPRYTAPHPYVPETTTFKIEPLSAAQMLPEITVNNVTGREGQGDTSVKDLFKEFLRVMFSQKDIEQYADLMDDTDIEANQSIADSKYVTKLDFEPRKKTEETITTVDIQLSKEIKEDDTKLKPVEKIDDMMIVPIDEVKLKSEADSKKLDENILTLLYLSESEKKEMAEDSDSGISIATESFRDLTHRSNATLDSLGKNEIYDIIAEAVDEVKNENGR